MAVKYIAGKRLKVGDGYREIGDEVPEAAGWRTLSAYLNTGAIKEVADVSVSSAASEDPPDDVEDRREALLAKTKNELKEIGRKADVAIYGSKNDIVQRLLDAE